MSEQYHRAFEVWETWRKRKCGCVSNDLGFTITYCGTCNMRKGTHHGKV